jgi:hypothetical protein
MISTGVSPGGIPRDIYILVYSFFFNSSWLCFLTVAIVQPWGVSGVWSYFGWSCSMWKMAWKNLEMSTVFMWYFIIWGRVRFWSAVGSSPKGVAILRTPNRENLKSCCSLWFCCTELTCTIGSATEHKRVSSTRSECSLYLMYPWSHVEC